MLSEAVATFIADSRESERLDNGGEIVDKITAFLLERCLRVVARLKLQLTGCDICGIFEFWI
jgi:hypothetical protein